MFPKITTTATDRGDVIQYGSVSVFITNDLKQGVSQFVPFPGAFVDLAELFDKKAREADLSSTGARKLIDKEVAKFVKPFNNARIGLQDFKRDVERRNAELEAVPPGDNVVRVETRQFVLGMSTAKAFDRLMTKASIDELDAVVERIDLFDWPVDLVERIRERRRLLNKIRIDRISMQRRPSMEQIAAIGNDDPQTIAIAKARMEQLVKDRQTAAHGEKSLQDIVRLIAGISGKSVPDTFTMLMAD